MRVPFFGKREAEGPALTDVQVVRARLTECDAEIAGAEETLRGVSLGAALGEDQADAYDALNHLNELRTRRELLTAALHAAQQAEHDAAQAERSREFAARRRAASQHAARLEREAKAVSDAEAELLSHFETMTEAAGSLVATLPEHMRSRAEPWPDLIGPDALRQLTLLEGYRLNRDRRAWLFQRLPGTLAIEDWETGQLPALTDRIAGFTATIREHFDQAAPPKPQTSPPEPEPVSSALVSPDVSPPSRDAVQRASEASIGEPEAVNA